MALFVVHLLEAVDIKHGEGDGPAGTLLSLHLPGEPLLEEVPAGVEVREVVPDGRALQALEARPSTEKKEEKPHEGTGGKGKRTVDNPQRGDGKAL